MSLASGTGPEASAPAPPPPPAPPSPVKAAPEERRILGNVSYVIAGSEESHRVQARTFAADILESPWFDNAIGFVIAANALCIGLESTARLEEWNSSLVVLVILENIWLAIYTVELALRFGAVHWRCLKDNWVKFDCLLVFSGVTTQWVLQPAGVDVSALGPLMVLRMMRLLRLARTLKLIVTVKELWLLVRSLLDSAGTMIYTMGLLLIILYGFACIGVELITFSPAARGEDADPEFQALVAEYFPSVLMTMMTLVQFVCFDSISGIYRPFVMLDPTPPLLTIYFAFAFVVMGIVLMNLITAVIVNSALEQAGKDKEAMRIHAERERRTLIKGLRKMFLRLDTDCSGTVTLLEVQSMDRKDREDLIDASGVGSPAEIFEALDVDGNGLLSIEDFCDGMWKVSASQVPLEVKRTEKQVAAMRETLKAVQQTQLQIQETLAQLQQHLAPGSLPPGEPCEDQAWADALAARLQRSVQLGVRAALGSAMPTPGPYNSPAQADEQEPPAWAGEILQELQRLRSECAATKGPTPRSRWQDDMGGQDDPLRATRADVGRGACAEFCRPSTVAQLPASGDVPFIGRRVHGDDRVSDSLQDARDAGQSAPQAAQLAGAEQAAVR